MKALPQSFSVHRVFIWLATGVGLAVGLARADDTGDRPGQDTTPRSYLSANGLLNRGLHELAIKEYRAFLAESPDHAKAPIARYGLAVCLFRTGQYQDAAAEMKAVRSLPGFPYAAEAGTVLGQCYLALQRFDQAAQALQQVVTTHPKHELADDAGALLAEALYRAGQHAAAIKAADRFDRRWPDSGHRTRAELFAGLAQMALEQFEDAARVFDALLKREPTGPLSEHATLLLAQCHAHGSAVEQAIRGYRRVLKQASRRFVPDALLGLAGLLQNSGQSPEAGRLLDRLLKEYAQSPQVASARLMRGRLWFDQQRYDRAEELFRQVADGGEALADQAAYWLGKCALRRGNFEAAAGMMAEAAGRFAQSDLLAEMGYDRCVALVRAGRLDQANEALERFLAEHADHALAADALHLLAVTQHRRKQFDHSRSACRQFLKRYSDHRLASQIKLLLAENDFLAGQFERAVKSYQRYLANKPAAADADQARLRMGLALYQLQRYDEAEPILLQQKDNPQAGDMAGQVQLALGDLLFRRQAWKESARLLEAYVSDGLDRDAADDALMKLALCRQRTGQHVEALESYDQLLEHFNDSPHRLHALFERGQVLLALDKPQPAAKAFEAVLAEGPDSRFAPHALNHLGDIAAGRSDYNDAAVRFALVAKQTDSAELVSHALYQQGQVLMADGEFDQAKSVLADFLDRYPDHDRAAQAQARLAICLSRSDGPDNALKAIERVESNAWSQLDEPLQRALLYEKAWCLRELGRTEDAAADYRRLLESDPKGLPNVHAMLELAEIHAHNSRYEQAAKLLTRLTQLARADSKPVPADVQEQALYRLGVCRFELGELAESVDLFEQLLVEYPETPLAASAGFFCGEACFRLGKHAQAAKHLQRVAESFPSDPASGPAMLRWGETLAAQQHWPQSEQVFGRYLDRFADSDVWFQAQFGLGWARENQGRYDEAIDAYRSLVDRHQGPTAARAQFQIGECRFAKKDYDNAIRDLLKVDILYAQPQWSAAALYEAGRCFEAMSKLGQARRQFQQVIEKHAQTHWAELAGQRLAELDRQSPRNHQTN
ncbi:MAG: tetratricopeptide repeat protein [Phycisphaerae bacterium]